MGHRMGENPEGRNQMPELKRCMKCVMPETWAGISFDEDGVCSICRNYEKKPKIDWDKRQGDLQDILVRYIDYAKVHGNKYECIVGYSGGKDTAYTLWAMVKKYKMKCLAVTWDHGFKLPPEAEYNMVEVPKKLDVDHLRFYIGGNLRNQMCRKGSEICGDFCIHCHLGVGAFPTRISYMMNIPLQIWGEPSAEYGTFGVYKYEDIEEQNYEHYKKVFAAGTMPQNVVPEGYSPIDLEPMTWPKEERTIYFEGKRIPFLKAIYLGNYEPWEQRKNVEIIKKELDWKPNRTPFYNDALEDWKDVLIETYGTYVDWDKVDCPYETVRNWQKFIRRGFDKLSFQCSKDIRDGLMTRDEALEIIKHEGQRPINMEDFCEETGISEAEFYRITNRQI